MNFTVTLILVLIAVIVTLGAVVYVLAKRIKEIKKEKSDLQNRLESARVNIEHLSKYIDDLLKIKSDEKSVSQKIKEAKNDEEVFNIIADIVGANNNRVQNNESN
jgi:prefoldin subunit 5